MDLANLDDQPLDDQNQGTHYRMWLVLGLIFFGGFLFWFLQRPIESGSFIYWIGLTMMGVPAWMLLEQIGELLFSVKVGQSMSRPWRIAYGVIVLVMLMLVVSAFSNSLSGFFGISDSKQTFTR